MKMISFIILGLLKGSVFWRISRFFNTFLFKLWMDCELCEEFCWIFWECCFWIVENKLKIYCENLKTTHGRSFWKLSLNFEQISQKRRISKFSVFPSSLEKKIDFKESISRKKKKICFVEEIAFSGFEEATEARLERNTCSDLDFICYFLFLFIFIFLCMQSSFWTAFEFLNFWSAWRVSRRLKFLGWAEMIECSLIVSHCKKVDGVKTKGGGLLDWSQVRFLIKNRCYAS
jgi:hypothetical protein